MSEMELKEFYALKDKFVGTFGMRNTDVRIVILAGITEFTELLQELPWKPWKKKSPGADRAKVLEEYVDVFHFWLLLGNELGFTPEEVEAAFLAKDAKNWKRQQDGY